MFYEMGEKPGLIGRVERQFIAITLGLMTIITFVNVVARYVFNSNVLWAVEGTVYLFAWLVLIGSAHCVAITAHLGVDAAVNLLGRTGKRIAAVFAVTACLAYTILLLIGSWQYWYPFVTDLSFLETEDIPMIPFVDGLAFMNGGEPYENLPRFIPYFVLPLSMAMLTVRFAISAVEILRGKRDLVVASHEVVDEIEDRDAHVNTAAASTPSVPAKEARDV